MFQCYLEELCVYFEEFNTIHDMETVDYRLFDHSTKFPITYHDAISNTNTS